MNIISKYILASLAISALIAVPLSGVISDYQEQLNLQKLDNASLEIEVEKKETKEQKLERKIKEIKQDKKKSDKQKQQQIEELKRKLHTKRERDRRERRMAFTQRAQAQEQERTVDTTANNNQSGSCGRFRSLLAQYDWNVDIAMKVMKHESGCDPNATSPTNDHGLFQLNGVPIYDPAENIDYAYHNKYVNSRVGSPKNWSSWYAVCTPGSNPQPKYPGVHCQ